MIILKLEVPVEVPPRRKEGAKASSDPTPNPSSHPTPTVPRLFSLLSATSDADTESLVCHTISQRPRIVLSRCRGPARLYPATLAVSSAASFCCYWLSLFFWLLLFITPAFSTVTTYSCFCFYCLTLYLFLLQLHTYSASAVKLKVEWETERNVVKISWSTVICVNN